MTSVDLATSHEPLIKAESLHVGYGQVDVLRDVSIEVRQGEFVGLLGPNGAGKTTLLMALAGYLKAKSGSILIDGKRGARTAHARARTGLGFVGEDRHVFPSLTSAQTMKLVKKSQRQQAYDLFPELERLKHRRCGLLSGGEQQMLAIGRALAARPCLLIVDELSLGLAPLVRERLLAVLRRVADEGAAILVVEQSAKSLVAVADRAYVLRRGEMIDERPARGWQNRLEDLGRLYLS